MRFDTTLGQISVVAATIVKSWYVTRLKRVPNQDEISVWAGGIAKDGEAATFAVFKGLATKEWSELSTSEKAYRIKTLPSKLESDESLTKKIVDWYKTTLNRSPHTSEIISWINGIRSDGIDAAYKEFMRLAPIEIAARPEPIPEPVPVPAEKDKIPLPFIIGGGVLASGIIYSLIRKKKARRKKR